MKKDINKLGRGLSSLLSPNKQTNEDETNSDNFKLLPISSIIANSNQPRKKFNKEELEDLASSIKSKGILQPIVVRKVKDDNFEIIAGERRWRASQLAGIHEMPTIIKEMDDDESIEAALIEVTST